VQRNIGRGTVLDIAYVGNGAHDMMQRRDINELPYWTTLLSVNPQNVDPTTGGVLNSNLLYKYPGYTNVYYNSPSINSNYNSLQVQANRRFTRGLQFGSSYTWSKELDIVDNPSGSSATVPTYQPLHGWDYGPAGWDRANMLIINFVWDLPKASRAWNNVLVRGVLYNWQTSGLLQFVDGTPTGAGCGYTTSVNVTGGGDGSRCVQVGGDPNLPRSQRTLAHWFNTSVFQPAARANMGHRG